MTITLDLTPELEQEVLDQASAAGVDAKEFVMSALAAKLERAKQATVVAPRLSAEESRLLQQINQGLPEKTWQRFRELIDKRRDETITDVELEELISITDRVERMNVERFGLLVELSRIRNMDVRDLMRELGIPDSSNG